MQSGHKKCPTQRTGRTSYLSILETLTLQNYIIFFNYHTLGVIFFIIPPSGVRGSIKKFQLVGIFYHRTGFQFYLVEVSPKRSFANAGKWFNFISVDRQLTFCAYFGVVIFADNLLYPLCTNLRTQMFWMSSLHYKLLTINYKLKLSVSSNLIRIRGN